MKQLRVNVEQTLDVYVAQMTGGSGGRWRVFQSVIQMSGEDRFLDPLSAEVFKSDLEYYLVFLFPACIPIVLFFLFLSWMGSQFFVNN